MILVYYKFIYPGCLRCIIIIQQTLGFSSKLVRKTEESIFMMCMYQKKLVTGTNTTVILLISQKLSQ